MSRAAPALPLLSLRLAFALLWLMYAFAAFAGLMIIGHMAKIAALARIKVSEAELEAMVPDLSLSTSYAGEASGRDNGGSLGSLYNDICRAAEQSSMLFFSRLDKVPNPGQGQNNVLSMGVIIKF